MKKLLESRFIVGVLLTCVAFLTATVVVLLYLAARNATSPSLEQTPSMGQSSRSVRDYFAITNRFYYEKHNESLAEMAVNLHFFDFDSLISDRYGKNANLTCTPIESDGGNMVFDYSFSTAYWRVELCTLVKNDPNVITTWINLFDPDDGSYTLESASEPVDYRVGNYVSNFRLGTVTGANHLFPAERKTFVDFLMMMETHALDQKTTNPFELCNLGYTRIVADPTSPDVNIFDDIDDFDDPDSFDAPTDNPDNPVIAPTPAT